MYLRIPSVYKYIYVSLIWNLDLCSEVVIFVYICKCMLYTLVCFCRNAFCGQLQCREGQLMTSPGISALFTLFLFGGGSIVCRYVHVHVHVCVMHVDTYVHVFN